MVKRAYKLKQKGYTKTSTESDTRIKKRKKNRDIRIAIDHGWTNEQQQKSRWKQFHMIEVWHESQMNWANHKKTQLNLHARAKV